MNKTSYDYLKNHPSLNHNLFATYIDRSIYATRPSLQL